MNKYFYNVEYLLHKPESSIRPGNILIQSPKPLDAEGIKDCIRKDLNIPGAVITLPKIDPIDEETYKSIFASINFGGGGEA